RNRRSCAISSPPPRLTASLWKPTAPIWPRPPTGASATNPPIPPIRRERVQRCSTCPMKTSPPRPRRISTACSPKPPRGAHDLSVHHSWLRLVRGGAAHRWPLGRLRPEQPQERPPPLFAAG